MSEPSKPPDDDYSLDVFREIKANNEKNKTLRLLIVSTMSLGALWVICDAAVRVFDIAGGDPPWLKLVELSLAFLIPAAAPAIIAWQLVGRFRLFVKNKTGRTIELESSIDAGRVSSNINPDGTGKHD